MNLKKFVSIIISLILCTTIFLGCGNNKEEESKEGTIKIGYLPITHALPLYAEKEVEKANIELVKFGSWPELMDALNSGKIDGASVLIELAMKAKAQGVDLKAVAFGHKEGNAVVVSEDINSVSDLKGKSFAIPSKLSSHYILTNEMMKEANLTVNDLNIIELSPTEMPVALQEGRISGYCVAEPFGAISVANGNAKILKQASDLIENSICCALVLRGEFIKDKENEAEEVVKKYVEAAKYLENKEAAAKTAKNFLKTDEKVIDLSLQWIGFDKLKIEKEDYERLLGEVKELNLIDNPPSYEDFVDNSLIDKVE